MTADSGKVVALLAVGKLLLEYRKVGLPKEDADLFLRAKDALMAFDPDRPGDEESNMRLLFAVYRTLGKCEISWRDYEVFAEWGKRAHELLSDPGEPWFTGKNKRGMSFVEWGNEACDRPFSRGELWRLGLTLLFLVFQLGRCSTRF